MSLPPRERATNLVAAEVCVRERRGDLDGSIASLGKQYFLLSGDHLPGRRKSLGSGGQASDKKHVLEALGTAATAMRINSENRSARSRS